MTSEVAALNQSWYRVSQRIGLATTGYWYESSGIRYSYSFKSVFDLGWQAAMEWKEQQEQEHAE